MVTVINSHKWDTSITKDMENHILKEVITEIKIESVQLKHQIESRFLVENKMIDRIVRILEICNRV